MSNLLTTTSIHFAHQHVKNQHSLKMEKSVSETTNKFSPKERIRKESHKQLKTTLNF